MGDDAHMNSDDFISHRDPNQWSDDTSKSYAISGKIMLIAIVVLFAVVLFMVALHIYARWYLLRGRRRNRRHHRQRQLSSHIVFYHSNSPYPAPYTSGLDSSVISSLPVFKYSAQTHACALECAVCLSEFEDDENGRLLPKCQHCFHVDCIGMWFQSHSTCPICRSPVDPAVLVTSNQNEGAVSVDVADSDSGSGLVSNTEQSGCTTCLTDRRKKDLDLVGVEVEDEESRSNSPACRTPGTRMLSLRRILSMNRKLVPLVAVSPSSDVGTSSSNDNVVAESDIEQGMNDSTRIQTQAQSPR